MGTLFDGVSTLLFSVIFSEISHFPFDAVNQKYMTKSPAGIKQNLAAAINRGIIKTQDQQ